MTWNLAINGKFTAQRLTGVQRVAEELVRALDDRPGCEGAVLLVPPQGRRLGLSRIREQVIGIEGCPLHAWEQFVLPRAARGRLLLNLAGGAPAQGARQICLLHDAAVFDTPEAYTVAFRTWYRWLFRRLARHAEAVMTVSAFSRDRLARALDLPADCIAVLPHGVDHLGAGPADPMLMARTLSRLGLSPYRYWLAVGSANPNKNLERLLRSHGALPAGRLPLALVGGADPGVFAEVRGKAAKDVLRLGPVTDEVLLQLYQGACGLVFPSVYEGFGLPPLEAMACGCPVIAGYAGALPEVCREAAVYVDPEDGQALSAAMQRLGEDVALRERLVRAGHAVAQGHRWRDAADRLACVLADHGVKV